METYELVVISLDINTGGLVVRISAFVPESAEMDLDISLRPPEMVRLKVRVIKIHLPEPVPEQDVYDVTIALQDPVPEQIRQMSGYLLSQLPRDLRGINKYRIQ